MLQKNSEKQQQSGLCSDCGCSFSQPKSDSTGSSSAPKQKETGVSPKCPSCQIASSSSRVSNGRRPHRGIRLEPHTCTLCSKTFISSAHLNLHLASHGKERKFKCNICGKYFHQSSHLIAHKTIHSGDRPFKCPECGKTFGRASHLKTHHRLHTGEKPFKCTYCDKSFTQKAGLLAHFRLHNGEKPCKCENCGEGFSSLNLLLSHKAQEACQQVRPEPSPESETLLKEPQGTENIMEGLKCGVCCRNFVRSSYIRLHMRLKKGQRPYHCKVCNKTFVKLETFVNHCDKHLRQKREKNKLRMKYVKPSLFASLCSSSPPDSSQTLSSEVNTRSRAKAKSKTEP